MCPLKSITEEYTIIDTLGNGANADVYKARHKKLGYVTAIKILKHPIVNENTQLYQRFVEECKVLLRLGNGGHDHIVKVGKPQLMVHYHGKDNRATVEMEFIEGRSLYDYINDNEGRLPLSEVFNLLTGISSALAYCHHDVYLHCINKDEDFEQLEGNKTPELKPVETLIKKYKIRHNDIHSKNIIRRNNGRYVLLDFGLAITSETHAKSSLRTKGNPEYKAPEKWDSNNVTEQSDIYSFGILMYEALTGKVPFPEDESEGPYDMDLMKKHREEIPQSIRAKRADCPQWLEEIIFKCVEKDPKYRFKNGKELFVAISGEIEREFKLENEHKTLVEKLKEDNRILKTRTEEKEKEVLKLYEETKELKSTIEKLTIEARWRDEEHEGLKRKNKTLVDRLEIVDPELMAIKVQAAKLSTQLAQKTRFKKYFYAALVCGLLLLTGIGIMYKVLDKKTYMVTNVPVNVSGVPYKYTGEMKNGLPNGKGKAVFKNEDQFDGYLADGKLLFGKYVWKESQNQFEGSFVDDDFYTGVAVFPDGTHHSTVAQKVYDCSPNK